MPVGEMLRRMDAAELEDWIEFYRLEPFGPLRDDLRFGMVVSAVLGSFGVSKTPAEIFESLKDQAATVQGPEEIRRELMRFHAIYGGNSEEMREDREQTTDDSNP
jgi:hypothetical protein